jgi:hypothetical protein
MDTKLAETIGVEAYTYLYPLVLMDLTRAQMTNVETAGEAVGRGPVDTFAHVRTFPRRSSRTSSSPTSTPPDKESTCRPPWTSRRRCAAARGGDFAGDRHAVRGAARSGADERRGLSPGEVAQRWTSTAVPRSPSRRSSPTAVTSGVGASTGCRARSACPRTC